MSEEMFCHQKNMILEKIAFFGQRNTLLIFWWDPTNSE